jgi:hypothetical protein
MYVYIYLCVIALYSKRKFSQITRERYSNPITVLDRPRGLQAVEASRFQDKRHMKVVRSALRIGRLYPPENIRGTHFCCRSSQHQGHSGVGRFMSMKNSNDTIGNRTRDLPACSAVPQPTVPKRTRHRIIFTRAHTTQLHPIPLFWTGNKSCTGNKHTAVRVPCCVVTGYVKNQSRESTTEVNFQFQSLKQLCALDARLDGSRMLTAWRDGGWAKRQNVSHRGACYVLH